MRIMVDCGFLEPVLNNADRRGALSPECHFQDRSTRRRPSGNGTLTASTLLELLPPVSTWSPVAVAVARFLKTPRAVAKMAAKALQAAVFRIQPPAGSGPGFESLVVRLAICPASALLAG
jgi:hypothetical protein